MTAKNGRTTIKIDPDVLARAKADAAAQGVTLSSLIDRALRESWIEHDTPPAILSLATIDSTGPPRIDLSPAIVKELLHEGDVTRYLDSLNRDADEAA